MQIGALEFIATIGCVGMIPLVLTIPTFSAQTYGTGAMAHTLYMTVISAFFLWFLCHLFFQFPKNDFLDISEYVGGKILKFFTTFLAISYLLTSAIIVLAEFNENIRNILFQNAPSHYISFIFLLGLLPGVFSGIKGIFRVATLITPLIIISLLLMFFSLYREIDITNYTPIFGFNQTSFWCDAFHFELFEGIILILLMGTKIKNPKKAAFFAFLLNAGILLLITTLLFGIIPYPSIVENYFPFFELSRLMSFRKILATSRIGIYSYLAHCSICIYFYWTIPYD